MFKILILITIISEIYCKDTTPVFIIDYLNIIQDNLVSNPLEAITENLFYQLLNTNTKNSEFIIFFVEDKFCQEDLTIKDNIGTPFHHLRQGIMDKKVKYLPAVYKPFEVLKKMFHPSSSNSHYVTSLNFNPDIELKKSKIAYIFFKDGEGESRAEMLRKHDVLMREIYLSISRNAKRPVLAFYTGKENPIVLEKIKYKIIPQIQYNIESNLVVDPGVTIRSRRTLFHFKGMAMSKGGLRTNVNEIPILIRETLNLNTVQTKLSYPEFDLHFEIDYDTRYWILRRVFCTVDNKLVGHRIIDMSINWGKSYVCGDPLTIRYRRDGETITIPHMQVQPFQEDEPPGGDEPPDDAPNDNFKFGGVEECTGHFSASILACLFVVFILLFVLYNGIQMLMAVQANDLYDDFKKPYCFSGQRAD